MSYALTQKDIKSLEIGDRMLGVAYIKEYTVLTSSSGNKYIKGTICAEAEMPMIVWSGARCFNSLATKQADYNGKVALLTFDVREFSGKPSAIISDVQVTTEYPVEKFLYTPYDIKDWERVYIDIMKRNISPSGFSLFSKIMNTQVQTYNKSYAERFGLVGKTLLEAFNVSFCARNHHDNCVGGLLAHSTKLISLLEFVVSQYPCFSSDLTTVGDAERYSLESDIAYKDILFLSAGLHDIGKVFEMNLGIYQPESLCTHREIGVDMLSNFKEDFVSLYGEHLWLVLKSVLLGHHDEFGDKARSVYAYIIHILDKLESELTSLQTLISNDRVDGVAGTIIGYEGRYLTL